MLSLLSLTTSHTVRFVAVWAGPELTLERVTRREEGTYQCGADNGVGQTKYKRVELLISCEYSVHSNEYTKLKVLSSKL